MLSEVGGEITGLTKKHTKPICSPTKQTCIRDVSFNYPADLKQLHHIPAAPPSVFAQDEKKTDSNPLCRRQPAGILNLSFSISQRENMTKLSINWFGSIDI